MPRYENINFTYGMPSGEHVYIIQPGPYADCEHDRDYGGSAPMFEVEHLAGQVQQIRDARDVGHPELDVDMPLRLREVQHIVASAGRDFHMRRRLGFAAVQLEEDAPAGKTVHVSELAVRSELVTGSLPFYSPETGRRYRPEHWQVVSTLLQPLIDCAPMSYLHLVVSSPNPSDAGKRTMAALGFGRWKDGQFNGDLATVNDRIKTHGIRQVRRGGGVWGWAPPQRAG